MSRLLHLRLTDFRNYQALDVSFSGAPAVLYGPNGAGKTNLLEALSLLSPGRGLRRARAQELARKTGAGAAPGWGVVADISDSAGNGDAQKLAVGQVPEKPGRRQVKIDGQIAPAGRLAETISLMWLTPAHDRLFTGPASERRKFLDRFALSHFPDHGSHVLRYEKARAQRGRLLADGIEDARWHSALEADLARYGAQLEQNRYQTLTAMDKQIGLHQDGPFPQGDIALESELAGPLTRGEGLEALTEYLAEILAQNRSLDQRAGRTLRGVHRSDLIVRYRDKQMPAADSSTGEQKALLIGLMLAQIRSLSQRLRILLLDEVAAHLDENRRAALIEQLLGLDVQLFMTGTDRHLFSAFDDRAQFFRVSAGSLAPDKAE